MISSAASSIAVFDGVPGMAIFLTWLAMTPPFLFVEHVAEMRALHETAIALTVKFEDIPRVAPRDRIELGEGRVVGNDNRAGASPRATTLRTPPVCDRPT